MVHGIIKNGQSCWWQSCGNHTGLEGTSSFYADNLAVVQVVQNLIAVDRLLCSLLQCLYFYSAHYQLTFTVTHIPGVKNVAADALSCNNLPLFHTLFLQVPQHTIPYGLAELFLLQILNWNSGT